VLPHAKERSKEGKACKGMAHQCQDKFAKARSGEKATPNQMIKWSSKGH